jgi:CxxC motif-containing protein (DUF1111 family)
MFHSSRITLPTLLAAIVTAVGACDNQATPTAPAPGDGSAPGDELVLSGTTVGDPLRFLTAPQLDLFFRGSAVFQTQFTPETGLGPLFNAVGCANCHENPVPGGSGNNDPAEGGEDVEVHATAFAGGVCSDLSGVGGPVIQQQVTAALAAALGIDKEPVPVEATATGRRTTPDLFGFGLLDAVPDWEILALADPFDRNGDGISGRPNRTADGRIGRFGRKAQVPRLRDFNTDAFVMEMGITNPGNQTEQTVGGKSLPAGVDPTPEPEITQGQFDAANAFVQLLAPPRHEPFGLVAQEGRLVFLGIGCASCHLPVLVTGPSPVAALSLKIFQPYTDLLLHDMGPELADICLGDARPAEFRTEPLMGLRFATALLHDGRAHTIAEAIQAHGGEATAARNRFNALRASQRAALLDFLGKL